MLKMKEKNQRQKHCPFDDEWIKDTRRCVTPSDWLQKKRKQKHSETQYNSVKTWFQSNNWGGLSVETR